MKRIAVIVGINQYWLPSWPALEFAEHDCRKLSDALSDERFGFTRGDIRILTVSAGEPAQHPFRNNLLYDGLFGSATEEPLDLFLFYFAGHGLEWKGESYLVPADGVPDRIGETCVPFIDVLDRVANVPAKQRLLIFDVCRQPSTSSKLSLPESFVRDAQRVRDAAVLCACDHGEASYEDRRLQGGVYTHHWCQGLSGAPTQDGVLTAFDVQRHADEGVRRWAAQNSRKQSPRIFLANCGTLVLSPPGTSSQPVPVNQWLHGPESRTENIVSVLSHVVNQPRPLDPRKYCVRIRAQVSSFAVTDSDHDNNPRLRGLLLEEDRLLRELLNKGASFKVLLSWNLNRYLQFRDMSADQVYARFMQLRDFGIEILNNAELLSRFTVVRLPWPERNLLILGDSYYFDGRKLRVRGGFDATQVFTDADASGRDTIQREIKMYDELFENGIEFVCEERGIPESSRMGDALNRALLEILIQDLDKDLANPELQQRLASN